MSSLHYLSSTPIPPGKNRFLSDNRSQVWLGEVSTWMVDRLGILRVVDFPFSYATSNLFKKTENYRILGKK